MERVRPLVRVRQMREFTLEPPTASELEAITEVARWSGSSRNSQPWRFIVVRDVATVRRLADAGMPQTRALRTASAAIAIVLPNEPSHELSRAYDDGRVAERMLIAASFLGLGAGIAWIRSDVRDAARGILALPPDRLVRTIVALGHPTTAALRPKSPKGQGRLPREELVFDERWPEGRLGTDG
jgi:nitroreductase